MSVFTRLNCFGRSRRCRSSVINHFNPFHAINRIFNLKRAYAGTSIAVVFGHRSAAPVIATTRRTRLGRATSRDNNNRRISKTVTDRGVLQTDPRPRRSHSNHPRPDTPSHRPVSVRSVVPGTGLGFFTGSREKPDKLSAFGIVSLRIRKDPVNGARDAFFGTENSFSTCAISSSPIPFRTVRVVCIR